MSSQYQLHTSTEHSELPVTVVCVKYRQYLTRAHLNSISGESQVLVVQTNLNVISLFDSLKLEDYYLLLDNVVKASLPNGGWILLFAFIVFL